MDIPDLIFKAAQVYFLISVFILLYTPTHIARKYKWKFILVSGPVGWIVAGTVVFLIKCGVDVDEIIRD